MTLFAGLATWCIATVAFAALCGRPVGGWLGLLIAAILLPLPAFVVAGPLGRTILSCGILFFFVRAWDLVLEQPPAGFSARLVHLYAPFDSRLVTRRTRWIDWRSMARLVVSASVVVLAFRAVKAADGLEFWSRYLVRSATGGLMVVAGFETLTSLTYAATALLGIKAPKLNDAPYRSRSLSEFWATRWNLSVTKILRDRCFRPLARYGSAPALLGAFAASGAGHAYMIGFVLGTSAALSWAAFFLVQPMLIAVERALGVRHWPSAAGRLWTISALIAVLPLFVEPAMRLAEVVL